MILIDANALVLLIIGLIDQNLISKHKRTSAYSKKDYEDLLMMIVDFNKLVVLPNVWTEVDNLLNRFSGPYRWQYLETIKSLINQTSERYLPSQLGVNSTYFVSDGLTDSLLVELAQECELFITGDSSLSDVAVANGIKVYDLSQQRSRNLRR